MISCTARARALTGLLLVFGTSCAPARDVGLTATGVPSTDRLLAAVANRDRARVGLRLVLRVRPDGATVATPAYLAVEGPARFHLQAVSPFGVTLLDLRVAGDRFTIRRPDGGVQTGHVDPRMLRDRRLEPATRMLMLLVLALTSDTAGADCQRRGDYLLACRPRGRTPLAREITLDHRLHVRSELLALADGPALATLRYDDHGEGPRRITLTDHASGRTTVVRVVRIERPRR